MPGTLYRSREDPGPTAPAGIAFSVLKKQGVEDLYAFGEVDKRASELKDYLDQPEIREKIRERHVLGAASKVIQEIVLDKAVSLGFQDEREGLFPNSTIQRVRPDYYCSLGNTGILLEVERERQILIIWIS